MIKRNLYFAPPVSWFSSLAEADIIMLADEKKFIEKTHRNRIEFTGISGVQSFSIPLLKNSKKMPYRQVEISYSENWQNHLINALRTAYGKSPFFEFYDYRIEPVIKHKFQYLFDLNLELLKTVLFCLKINAQIVVGDFEPETEPLEEFSVPYYQVFADKIGFKSGLSILDLLFNEGINAGSILMYKENN